MQVRAALLSGGVLAALAITTSPPPLAAAGMGTACGGALLSRALLERTGPTVGLRALLLAHLVGLAMMLCAASPTVFTAVSVALCLVVVVGAAWESERIAVVLWTLATIVVWLGAAAIGPLGQALAREGPVETAIVVATVPLAFGALAAQTRDLTRALESALGLSEVARSKLARSNTELARSMERTEDALGKLGTIVDTLADGVIAVRADGRIELANAAAPRLLELDAVPADGLASAVLPSTLQELVRLGRSASGPTPREIVTGGRTALAVASPVRIGGQVWGVVLLIRDVTLEREIDRMKGDFAAMVSHELRTPLTSVLGFTKLVSSQLEKRVFPHVPEGDERSGRAVGTVRTNLAVIDAEARRLTALIDDVLDLSKLESGQAVFAVAPVDVDALLAEVEVGARAVLAERPELTLTVDVAPGTPPVRADRARVLHVFRHLIGNAVKFTREGGVQVGARPHTDGVELFVQDTGVGIRPSDADVIFEKFVQAGNGDLLTDRPSGTGLGLPICRAIVERLGGRIRVEPVAAGGCRFVFTLPIAG